MTNDAEAEEQVERLFDYLSALAQEVYAKPVWHLGTPVEAATVHGRSCVTSGTAHRASDWTALARQAAAALGENEAATLHLVVDEGQDLSPGFYRMARCEGAGPVPSGPMRGGRRQGAVIRGGRPCAVRIRRWT